MIEKQIVNKKVRSYLIQVFMKDYLPKASYSRIELKKTPLGDKIIVHTSRPGLVVGRKGANIANLTKVLKEKFNMENPQVEVAEIEEPNLDPKSVAERIVSSFERFGPKRFKSLGYRSLQGIMDAGAVGAEIVISGRGVPSARSRSWRFSAGHLKKSGDISENYVKRTVAVAELKSGAVGINVSILTPDVELPDDIKLKQESKEIEVEEEKEAKKEEKKGIVKKETKEEKDAEQIKEPSKKEKKKQSKVRSKQKSKSKQSKDDKKS